MNIRAEAIIMLSSSGTGEANANREEVRPTRGRKPKMRHSSIKLEAPSACAVGSSPIEVGYEGTRSKI
ncbi:hypothetical protein [Microseira sp. BLCC-F43]|uniref:hypothetical protein n=1 Tax=Microseira sp. BLCC-F43 TaxID=3153602 RepID=UPI0035B86629